MHRLLHRRPRRLRKLLRLSGNAGRKAYDAHGIVATTRGHGRAQQSGRLGVCGVPQSSKTTPKNPTTSSRLLNPKYLRLLRGRFIQQDGRSRLAVSESGRPTTHCLYGGGTWKPIHAGHRPSDPGFQPFSPCCAFRVSNLPMNSYFPYDSRPQTLFAKSIAMLDPDD